MPRGPLPAPTKRRTNEPTIPTTSLPAKGRSGPIPRIPKWVKLGPAGTAWWRWAWRTPQAAGWAHGHEAYVAKRAALEDDLAALAAVEGLDTNDILRALPPVVKTLITQLAGLATGRLAIQKVMLEMDNRLGLNPKGMADLRWTVVATPEAVPSAGDDEVSTRRQDRRARLSAS